MAQTTKGKNTTLAQIVAIERGVKTDANKRFTRTYQLLEKKPLLSGLIRTYRPKDDEGDQLPPEQTNVQLSVEDAIAELTPVLSRMWDVTFTKDTANQEAKADIVVGGTTLLSDVPVSFMLYLEKQLTDLATFISKLPTLDPSETWTKNAQTSVWETEPIETTRSQKVLHNHVLAAATDKHPAQVTTYQQDVLVGYWRTVKLSGGVPQARVSELLSRVEILREAVKYAREEANALTVTDVTAGKPVFDYLFAE